MPRQKGYKGRPTATTHVVKDRQGRIVEPTGYSLYVTETLPDFVSDRGRFNRIQDYYYEGVSE